MHARTRNSIGLEESHSREIASNLTYSIDWDAAPAAAAAAVIKVNITFFPIYVRVTYVRTYVHCVTLVVFVLQTCPPSCFTCVGYFFRRIFIRSISRNATSQSVSQSVSHPSVSLDRPYRYNIHTRPYACRERKKERKEGRIGAASDVFIGFVHSLYYL